VTLAILSDIHGNLEALDAVLADVAATGAAPIACLGDYVGYGANPNECLARLRPLLDVGLLGNHDVAALGRLRLGGFNSDAATTARWTRERLDPGNREWLDALPMTAVWHGIRLVHASPSDPEEWNYVLSVHDAEIEFEAFEEPLCVIGHSHVPGNFVRERNGVRYQRDAEVTLGRGARYLVNIGSVGQPRDGDSRAAYALIHDDPPRLEHRRVEYDVAKAAAAILAAGLPQFLAERLRWGE
jgi:diadenosine tetraphosphatase ApaH/serine/threonine PP2A family protein phosphatase